MIIYNLPENLQQFIQYLNQNEEKLGRDGAQKNCALIFLPFHDTVQGSTEDSVGFAVYDTRDYAMYVAGDVEDYFENEPEEAERMLFENIVHEYIHHLQRVNGEHFNKYTLEILEEEAETKARIFVTEYFEWRNING